MLANTNGNLYSGPTTINAGVLALGNSGSVQNSTVTVNAANGLGFVPGTGRSTSGPSPARAHWPCPIRAAERRS